MNQDLLDSAISICRMLIQGNNDITDEVINNAIDNVVSMPMYSAVSKDLLKSKLLTLFSVRIDPMKILVGRERRIPWLASFKAQETCRWNFWNRYKLYLAEEKHFEPATIHSVDALTDNILDSLFNPQLNGNIICKKGLVVGQVQSGKTANYTGLICKAADAGFNFIVVLAGIHNNLRSQTQLRLDEGFLGFDTQFERAYSNNNDSKIGVGKIPGFKDAIANSYTTNSEKGDFTRASANACGFNFNAPQPALLVLKKNASVLKRVNAWLQVQTTKGKISNKSLLIIDDEADNASINTNKAEEDPTTINRNIREIIDKFYRAAYVGYTATPFANIFIPQDDSNLFPKDFIINLPAPSTYIGPDKVFGTSLIPDDSDEELLPITNIISDYSDFVPNKHKKDDPKPTSKEFPNSLRLAIKCFIITCAVRYLRGHENKHNSMLIHVTRYKSWQEKIKDLVNEVFLYYKHEIEAGDEDVLEELRLVYEKDSDDYNSYKTTTEIIKNSPRFHDIDDCLDVYDWQSVRKVLFKAVQKICVMSVNGSSKDTLTYYNYKETGISVIVVGGDKLSRGLTLEGLSISYFLRASKMYDTLMQMGRWFGYRHGYVDLCRLFVSAELNEWYRHITLASEELREEFNYLHDIGGTPEDYALRVRNHPGVLQITSLAKMRYVDKVDVSWASRLVETYQLLMDEKPKKENFELVDKFLCSLGVSEKIKETQNQIWRDVNVDKIFDLFDKFQLPKSLVKVNLRMINEYIREVNKFGELTSWNVIFMNKPKGERPNDYDGCLSNGERFNVFLRTNENDSDVYMIKKNHVLGNPNVELQDIDPKVLDDALAETKKRDKEWKEKYPKPKIVREEYRDVKHALLIIYPIKPEKNYVWATGAKREPYIGLAISFPHTNSGVAVSYTVNQISAIADTEEFFEYDEEE